MQVAPSTTSTTTSTSSSAVSSSATATTTLAVDTFGHKTWKTTTSFPVGVWDSTTQQMQVVSIDTKEMGLRCHDLDTNGIPDNDDHDNSEEEEEGGGKRLRPADRDGKRRPYQPGELVLSKNDDQEVIVPKTTPSLWYVPFCVMPDMDNNTTLFDQWESLVLQLINNHKLPDTDAITDLALAHRVLPNAGTKAFGMDLHLQVQRWLADRLTAEWEGTTTADHNDGDSWLQLYTETIRAIVQPFMERYYNSSKFYVQKHPKNLRLQMPGMKSVQHWHCDHMFAHPRGEINFSLCLTEFKQTAGICLELLLPDGTRQVFPILAGAGSIVVAPFGYCPHGNKINSESQPDHTRVSIDWRIITQEDMEAAQAKSSEEALGASATSGLLYAPGAYYGLWDAALNNWVDGPKKATSAATTTTSTDDDHKNVPASE